MSETKKVNEVYNAIEKLYDIDEIDEINFDNIIEGWDPSLRGCSVKWDHQKRKWIVVK